MIVCEGETEKIYLSKFKSLYKLSALTIEVESAGGGSAMKVYRKAKQIKVNSSQRKEV